MATNIFTIEELEKMISDREGAVLQILPDDKIARFFPEIKDRANFRREISEQDANALSRNMVSVTKQLLGILEATPKVIQGQFSPEELKSMLIDYETYWRDRSGRGDVEAEKAGNLPRNIRWIATQLIEALK